MADAVAVQKLWETPYQVAYHLTDLSDGTGEAAVTKAARSAMNRPDGQGNPSQIDFCSVRWDIQGMTQVKLAIGTSLYYLASNGYDEPNSVPGQAANDLVLTTTGAAAGGTYDITIVLNKRN